MVNNKIRNIVFQEILIILILIIGNLLFLTGCGQSYEKTQAQKEVFKKEEERKKVEEEKRAIEEIEEIFNAKYFPPKNIDHASYTYEIQQFFKLNSDNNIVFKAYLDDIIKVENSVYIEFECPLEDNSFFSEKVVNFRLSYPEKEINKFLEASHNDPIEQFFKYFYEPDYYVIAKINKIQRFHKYEFDGTAYGEEVEIELDVSRNVIARGKLVRTEVIVRND